MDVQPVRDGHLVCRFFSCNGYTRTMVATVTCRLLITPGLASVCAEAPPLVMRGKSGERAKARPLRESFIHAFIHLSITVGGGIILQKIGPVLARLFFGSHFCWCSAPSDDTAAKVTDL